MHVKNLAAFAIFAEFAFDHFMGTRPYRIYKFIIKTDNNLPHPPPKKKNWK